MIIGSGIDIVEINRISKAIKNERFKNRFYSQREILYCEGRGKLSVNAYAGFFAAKEAFVKALGIGFVKGKWKDIEILKLESGQPYIVLNGYWLEYYKEKNISKIFLSISHSNNNAIANVILEG